MKILESKANRYDKGINIITLGFINKLYSSVNSYFVSGYKILDLGCGTGNLTLRAASNGAFVKGLDINAEMISICQNRAKITGLKDKITLEEKGVAEITDEPSISYDIIMSSLCFSELSNDEIHFTLREAYRILKPNGLFIVIDEVIPKNFIKRILHSLLRLPVIIITYILTQTTTKAVKNLPEKLKEANFVLKTTNYYFLGSLAIFVASKPDKTMLKQLNDFEINRK